MGVRSPWETDGMRAGPIGLPFWPVGSLGKMGKCCSGNLGKTLLVPVLMLIVDEKIRSLDIWGWSAAVLVCAVVGWRRDIRNRMAAGRIGDDGKVEATFAMKVLAFLHHPINGFSRGWYLSGLESEA